VQNQRGALALLNGRIFVPFGGHYGDCGSYHGVVIAIAIDRPQLVDAWSTRASKGGIWAPAGLSEADGSLYFTTGNTEGAQSWQDGEGVFRVGTTLAHSTDPRDFFAPSNWKELDDDDLDLSGVTPLPLTVPGSDVPLILALGKDGNAYLADRTNLGGIGGQLAEASVSSQQIRTAPAVYSTSAGTMLAFTNYGSSTCSGTSITMLNILASGSQLINEAWCTTFSGQGAPIITTTDGTSNPIVWVVGAEGDDVLHGFNATNGQVVYTGTDSMSGLHHYQTLIAANRHFYVGADNTVYAFTF